MKKIVALFLSLCLALGCVSLALAEGKFIPGTYEGVAFGFGGDIKATVTVDENAITAIELFGPDETAMLGGAALKTLEEAYIGKASATDVDTVVSATISSKGAQDAVAAALNLRPLRAGVPVNEKMIPDSEIKQFETYSTQFVAEHKAEIVKMYLDHVEMNME